MSDRCVQTAVNTERRDQQYRHQNVHEGNQETVYRRMSTRLLRTSSWVSWLVSCPLCFTLYMSGSRSLFQRNATHLCRTVSYWFLTSCQPHRFTQKECSRKRKVYLCHWLAGYPFFGLFVEDVALVDFIYFLCLFTRMPGESYRGKFRSVARGFKVLLSFLPLGDRKQSYIPTMHSS